MAIEYGLKSFQWKGTGDAALVSLGKIIEGTPKFFGDKASDNAFYAAQNPDYPAIIVTDKKGIQKITLSLMELDPDVLVKVMGGTATGTAPNKTYAAPRGAVEINGSCELVTDTNQKISIPNGHLKANFNWTLDRKSVSTIEVEISIMLPTVDTDMPYTISRAV